MSDALAPDLTRLVGDLRTEIDHFMYTESVRRREPRSGKVLGYVRVSTEEQAISGLGLSDQRGTIAAEAQRRAWTDLEIISDEGRSAASLVRPGLTEALAMLRDGQAGVLVAAKLDRLSRSVHDFSSLMERSQREGWELVVLDVSVDTGTPGGRLMANVMASFAEYERLLVGVRTSAALQQLKEQGVRLGRPREIPEDVMRRIAQEHSGGASYAAIAKGLNEDQVPTARGGAQWYRSTVQAALRSLELDEVRG